MRLKKIESLYPAGLVAAVASMALVWPAQADVTLINDTFDTPPGATRIDDAADSLDAAWWDYGTGPISYAVDNSSPGIGTDNTLVLEGAAPKVVANFSDVTLANPGDWIKFSFDMRWIVATTADVNIRFGLFNNNPDSAADSVVDADGQAARTGNDIGYWVLTQPDGYISTKDGTSFFGGSTMNFASAAAVPDLGDAEAHNITLTITREDATQMRVAASQDGTEYVTGLDSVITTDTFNEVGLFQTIGIDLRLDNLEVTTNVPEPGALGLVATGMLLMVVRRKK